MSPTLFQYLQNTLSNAAISKGSAVLTPGQAHLHIALKLCGGFGDEGSYQIVDIEPKNQKAQAKWRPSENKH